ncbi:PIG-L deacetylase family protein [Tepidamorphus sp. 3E244]|uniref:PIG-L deacetylase family protein n=1 Tax=Tepidamorphus sp. 3E244 TaxID=3385498 RepID=UPI0038FC55FC
MAARARHAPTATLEQLAGSGDVLALVPHPDDESLAMGGAIAAASSAGRQVHVVMVTDGARSHPNSRTHPPHVLSALRRRELADAVSVLTGDRGTIVWLGYPDMAAPDSAEAFGTIGRRISTLFFDVTAIWTTWNGDPHPDHQRVWRLGEWLASRKRIPKLFGCPVWGRVQTPVEGASSEGMLRFPTADYRFIKARAIAAHGSQMTGLIADDPEGFRMPRDLAQHFVEADEIFIPA